MASDNYTSIGIKHNIILLIFRIAKCEVFIHREVIMHNLLLNIIISLSIQVL